jgi:hypothetical protein
LRIIKILCKQLKVEAKGAKVVFDFMNEPTCEFRKFCVGITHSKLLVRAQKLGPQIPD